MDQLESEGSENSLTLANGRRRQDDFRILEGSNLTFIRVLEVDHPFITACELGDIDIVRAMLRSGDGRASDVAGENWNTLAVSNLPRSSA